MLSEISSTEEDKYCLASHIWILKRKKDKEKLVKVQTISHKMNKDRN